MQDKNVLCLISSLNSSNTDNTDSTEEVNILKYLNSKTLFITQLEGIKPYNLKGVFAKN